MARPRPAVVSSIRDIQRGVHVAMLWRGAWWGNLRLDGRTTTTAGDDYHKTFGREEISRIDRRVNIHRDRFVGMID
jgi:hypothetical protein